MFLSIVVGSAFVVAATFLVLVVAPESIFYIVAEAVGYTVARLVLPLVSLGRVRVQPFNPSQNNPSLFACRSDGAARIEIGYTLACIIGFFILLIGFFTLSSLIQAFT